MKQRFSALDLCATVTELQKLVGLRLSNIYDINQKTFLLKFQKPEHKELVLIESGIRIHSTSYTRDKQLLPSNFNVKLRKHLKTRRLSAISQVGVDRKIDLQFGDGEFSYHLILEFFASGNIILTDHELKIMALSRVVELDDLQVAVGQIYDLCDKQSVFSEISTEFIIGKFKDYIESEKQKQTQSNESPEIIDPEIILDDLHDRNKKGNFVRSKKKRSNNLRHVLRLCMSSTYGPALVDHALAISGLDPMISSYTDFTFNSVSMQTLVEAFQDCDKIIEDCKSGREQRGYIVCHKDGDLTNFEEFQPFRPLSIKEDQELLELDSFDLAVDEYFSKVESQKLQAKAKQAEGQALKKLEKVRSNNASQIKNFQISQERKNLMALALESNLELVDSCIKTIRSFVASGMDWQDLKDLVLEEQRKGNPLALAIIELKLDSGSISLSLPQPSLESDSDSSEGNGSESDDSSGAVTSIPHKQSSRSKSGLVVDVDIYETAYANARNYYDAKKLAISKEKKTIQASVKAIEHAETKIMETLHKKEVLQTTINKYRPPLWFERFLWFITTENYLVIGGRDAQQAELLVTKYMKPGDIYMSADMEASTSVIIKGQPGNPPVVPMTSLIQAGTMCVCHSKAWDAKIVTSAFWVTHDQVFKTTNAGVLAPGVFDIRGRKNHLPPVQLIYGIALLFQVDELCVVNHYSDRRPWDRMTDVGASTGVDKAGSNAYTKLMIEQLNESKFEVECIQAQDDITSPSIVEAILESRGQSIPATNNPFKMPTKHKSQIKKDTEASNVENTCDTANQRDTSITTSNQGEVSKPLVRGKKSKLKKMNAKYADQDDEDREKALELLGSAKGPTPKGKKAKAQALNDAQLLAIKVSKLQLTDTTNPYGDKDSEGAESNISLNSKDQKKFVKVKDHASALEISQDFEVPDTMIDDLVGNPLIDDILINCIPVCAPWIALQKYKYKIKMIPGSLKRGKAVKLAVNSFLSVVKIEQEIEMVKMIPESEWITTMLSKVKLIQDKK